MEEEEEEPAIRTGIRSGLGTSAIRCRTSTLGPLHTGPDRSPRREDIMTKATIWTATMMGIAYVVHCTSLFLEANPTTNKMVYAAV